MYNSLNITILNVFLTVKDNFFHALGWPSPLLLPAASTCPLSVFDRRQGGGGKQSPGWLTPESTGPRDIIIQQHNKGNAPLLPASAQLSAENKRLAR